MISSRLQDNATQAAGDKPAAFLIQIRDISAGSGSRGRCHSANFHQSAGDDEFRNPDRGPGGIRGQDVAVFHLREDSHVSGDVDVIGCDFHQIRQVSPGSPKDCAQGFKGGSFDPRGQTSAAPDLDQNGTVSPDEVFAFMQFDPEEVDSYEIGWKASTFEGRVQTSLAGFFMEYKDVQIPGSVGLDTDNDGVNDTFTGVTTNAASADLWGVEFEGSALLAEEIFNESDMFSSSLAVGYINAEFNEFIDAFGNDVADQRVFQNTPEWTGSLRLTYDTPLQLLQRDGRFTINSLASYRSESSQFEVRSPLDQEAYTLVDLGLRWKPDDSRWGFTVTGKNLTDERYKVAGYNFINPVTGAPTLGLEGVLNAYYGDPRTFSFGVDYEF